jgi:hypothetical protein
MVGEERSLRDVLQRRRRGRRLPLLGLDVLLDPDRCGSGHRRLGVDQRERRPVGGLRLGLGALWRAFARLFGRKNR